jgi:hypothetical protein
MQIYSMTFVRLQRRGHEKSRPDYAHGDVKVSFNGYKWTTDGGTINYSRT